MSKIRSGVLLAGLVAMSPTGLTHAGGGTAFDHGNWNEVLSRFVDQRGLVDYEGLAQDRAALDRYVAEIAEAGPRSTPERFPSRSDELAYYVNAYNAFVFQGVVEGDIDAKTVWSGLLPGYGFFVGRKFRLDGKSINLRNLENKIVRARYGDARVHAALNCASVGCPRLPTTAFGTGSLEDELNAAMTDFVTNERNVRVDAANRTVYLSKIFDWYRDDFLDDERELGNPEPTLIDYVNRFRKELPPIPGDYSVEFPDYDKRINRQPDTD